jgi:hypothetical protein
MKWMVGEDMEIHTEQVKDVQTDVEEACRILGS